MKAVVIDHDTSKCAKCGAFVKYARGLGTFFHGASESYEDWEIVEHKFCPECGEKVEK